MAKKFKWNVSAFNKTQQHKKFLAQSKDGWKLKSASVVAAEKAVLAEMEALVAVAIAEGFTVKKVAAKGAAA